MNRFHNTRLTFVFAIICTLASGLSLFGQSQPPSRSRVNYLHTYPSPNPAASLQNALQQRQGMDKAVHAAEDSNATPSPATPSYAWSPVGQAGIVGLDGSYQGGRIAGLAVDPRNPDIVYLASAGGGVWKSTDDGITWASVNDALLSMSGGTLAFDWRTGSQGTLYYGTGDALSGISYGSGILKSSDGGATWQQMGVQFGAGQNYTYRIGVSPNDTQTVFAARATVGSDSGIWRTSDGGATWFNVLAGYGTDVQVSPVSGALAYAALGNPYGDKRNGVYRSLDGGTTWTLLSGLPAGGSVGRISLALTAADSRVVCALVSNFDWSFNGAYCSNDFGGTWRQLGIINSLLFYNGSYNRGDYHQLIYIDPANANNIYVGGYDLYRSTDGGNTFAQISSPGGQRLIHGGMFTMASMPASSNAIYVGTEGGAYRSLDGGQSWTNLNKPVPVSMLNAIAMSPGGKSVIAGGESVGVVGLNADRNTFKQFLAGYFGTVFFDPSNPNIIYGGQIQSDLWRSGDGGATWSSIGSGISSSDTTAFYPPFIADPNNAGNLLFGTSRVWRSNVQGAQWAPASPQLANKGAYITALAVVPGTGRIYAVTSDGSGYFSADGSFNNWQPSAGLPGGYMTAVAPDPIVPLRAYATAWGFGIKHVFRTDDGGANWTSVDDNLPDAPVNGIAVDPAGPVYVATDVGVFRSSNGQGGWASYNQGLPTTYVNSLAIDPISGTMVAATYGRGAYIVNLKPVTSNVPSIRANGVVEAISGSVVLSPGALATIYGTNLATATATGSPVTGSTTVVTVNGVVAPMLYVSPTQINFIVPFEATNSEASIVVTTPNGSSSAYVQVALASPGIDAVLHANSVAVSATNPATAGETLTIIATGLGDTTPGSQTGVPAAAVPFALAAPVTVVLQTGSGANLVSTSVPVLSAGQLPGGLGLNLVQFAVPSGISGNISLSLISQGRASNQVTIVVR